MAYAINPGDIVQVTVKYAQVQIVTMMNVFHYRYLGPSVIADGAANLNNLGSYFNSNLGSVGWGARWAVLSSNLANIDRYDVQKIYPVRFGVTSFDVAIPGDVVEDPLPGLVQYSLTKRGDIATRYSVGGCRVPGLAEGLEQGSELGIAALALANNLADLLAVNMTPNAGEEWEPIVYRRTNPGSSVKVVEAFAQKTLRSQRTRIAFRGI